MPSSPLIGRRSGTSSPNMDRIDVVKDNVIGELASRIGRPIPEFNKNKRGWQLPIRVRDLRLLREDPDLHLRPLDDPTRNQPLRLLLVTPALECRQNENLQRREPVWQRPVP